MKRIASFRLFVLSLIMLFPSICLSQWEMSIGLEGAEITEMVSSGPYLFACCSNHGVYRFEESSSWTRTDDGTTYQKIAKAGNCLFIYDTYYFGLGCKRSFNDGDTWEWVPNLTDAWHIYTIDSTIFFYSGSSPIKRSIDYGNIYDTILLPDEINVSDFLCDDSLLYIHHSDQDTHSLFYSSDMGYAWDTISTDGLFPMGNASVKQIKFLNGTWWAQTQTHSAPYTQKGVFVYNHNNSKWLDITGTLPKYWEFGDLFGYDGDILCCFETSPVCKFNFQDSTWIPFTNDSKSVKQFLTHNNELYCACDQGSFVIDNNGNWISNNEGLNFRSISSINYTENKLYVTANNELYYSGDDGVGFSKSLTGSGHQVIATDSVLYMLSASDFKITRDDGITWDTCNDGIDFQHYQKLIHLSITPYYYFISTYQGIYRSPVSPISWTKLENGPFNIQMRVDNIEAIGNTVIAGADYPPHDLFFSDDHGDLFVEYGEYCEFRELDQVYYLLKDSIWYSDDMAQNWSHIPNDYDHIYYCIERSNDTVILGGRNASADPVILISYNLGSTWIDVWDNMPFQMYIPGKVRNLKLLGNRLFADNPKNGLWYRDDLLVNIHEHPICNDGSLTSIKTYPNPVRSYIKISGLDKPGTYRLFDLTGQVVQTGNTDSNRIDVMSLPSGIYFLEIKTDRDFLTRKIIKY